MHRIFGLEGGIGGFVGRAVRERPLQLVVKEAFEPWCLTRRITQPITVVAVVLGVLLVGICNHCPHLHLQGWDSLLNHCPDDLVVYMRIGVCKSVSQTNDGTPRNLRGALDALLRVCTTPLRLVGRCSVTSHHMYVDPTRTPQVSNRRYKSIPGRETSTCPVRGNANRTDSHGTHTLIRSRSTRGKISFLSSCRRAMSTLRPKTSSR